MESTGGRIAAALLAILLVSSLGTATAGQAAPVLRTDASPATTTGLHEQTGVTHLADDPRWAPTETSSRTRETATASRGNASPPRNPWRKNPVVVEVAPFVYYFLRDIRNAATYWEGRTPEHAGFTVNFTFTADADDPDVRIKFAGSTPERCGERRDACALGTVGPNETYLTTIFGRQQSILVPVMYLKPDRSLERTDLAIREFGRILGIAHCSDVGSASNTGLDCPGGLSTNETAPAP